jgi:ABC-2 type transport system ATP-binding protein
MNGIEVKKISKSYGTVKALEDVSLTLGENKIYGLLGRNGAGKTTLLNIITNRIFEDNGEVLIDGEGHKDNDKALGKLYMMGESDLYPENMKIRDVFKWTKTFYPDFDKEYAEKAAERFGLSLKKKTNALSTGYKSIFKLILALSVNTPYILLDEPVLGLDANHRELFYKLLLEKYAKKPFTAVISTHLIEEVSGIIEDVIIVKNGRVIRNESCEELLSKGYTVSGAAAKVDSFIKDKQIIGTDTLGGLKTAYILGKAEENVPEGLEITRLDLQKLFIQLTNE